MDYRWAKAMHCIEYLRQAEGELILVSWCDVSFQLLSLITMQKLKKGDHNGLENVDSIRLDKVTKRRNDEFSELESL